MKVHALLALAACLALSACDYRYNVQAVLQNGVLQFTADWGTHCLREVWVQARSGPIPGAAAGDDANLLAHRVYWAGRADYEIDCANTFPLRYGPHLLGEAVTGPGRVSAKALLRDVIYDIRTNTGPKGYGSGCFVIHRNGRVQNLPH